jgi:hypothetical protein
LIGPFSVLHLSILNGERQRKYKNLGFRLAVAVFSEYEQVGKWAGQKALDDRMLSLTKGSMVFVNQEAQRGW